jgi:hypothetical protein
MTTIRRKIGGDLAVCELGLGRAASAMDLLQKAERTNLELGALPNLQICSANSGNVFCETGDCLDCSLPPRAPNCRTNQGSRRNAKMDS